MLIVSSTWKVSAGGGFIQEDYGCIGQDRPRDGDASHLLHELRCQYIYAMLSMIISPCPSPV